MWTSNFECMLTIDPKEIPVPKLHHYLLGAIGPRPIAFASTVDANGIDNLAPFSFFNVFSANPPILIFSPARSGRTNETKDTYNNVKVVPEVVINVVNYDIVHQMSLASSPFAPGVSEFDKAGFTPIASKTIRPKRVAESPIQFECKVIEVKELGNQGGAGNLIFCEVMKIHINEAVLDENGSIDQHKIDLVARAGGSYYTRARDGFFEIPKPIATLGIGVDAIPLEIRNSPILTGNNLGMLGNVEQLPTEDTVNNFGKEHSQFIGLEMVKKHTFAQEYLSKNDVESAWKVLLLK